MHAAWPNIRIRKHMTGKIVAFLNDTGIKIIKIS